MKNLREKFARKRGLLIMEENANIVNFEEVTDGEIDDIWDMLFPQITETREKVQKWEHVNQTKPRRYLKFLTMCFGL